MLVYSQTGERLGPPTADATLGAKTLNAIKMSNRNTFVGDSRPEVKNRACVGC